MSITVTSPYKTYRGGREGGSVGKDLACKSKDLSSGPSTHRKVRHGSEHLQPRHWLAVEMVNPGGSLVGLSS